LDSSGDSDQNIDGDMIHVMLSSPSGAHRLNAGFWQSNTGTATLGCFVCAYRTKIDSSESPKKMNEIRISNRFRKADQI